MGFNTEQVKEAATILAMQRSGDRSYHGERYTLHYKKQDVAEACGIHPKSLSRYCRAHNIDLTKLSLIELVDFIQSYRTKDEPDIH